MVRQQLFRREVDEIQFGLLSPEEVKASSVVKVEYPETMEGGVPKSGGLIDCRMGTTERDYLCATCGQDMTMCVGHFGHIELVKPVFHVSFISKVKKVLECICFYCSRLKIDRKKLQKSTGNIILSAKNGQELNEKSRNLMRNSLNKVWKLSKGKTICHGDEIEDVEGIKITGCGSRQPLIKKEGLGLVAFMKGEESTEGKVILNGERIYNILKKIPEEDSLLMGFDLKYSRPEWMLITVLLVPPPAVRPSIVMEGVLRSEDDLTHKLSDIIKANNNLQRYEMEGAPPHIIRDYEQLLQFHVATFMNNDISGQPQSLQKTGRPLKSLSARLKGKEGRIRGNLMGKRVDFSARTVITPDPNIGLNEVGVPIQIAMVHTFPEKVTAYNLEKLTDLVRNGPGLHPGANYVTRADNTKVDLRFCRDIVLRVGDTVERHMLDGDYVLFNRQPSLHKMSMMCHRAKIMNLSTFRLNLSATSPYGADFDGDEMNLHMPQSVMAQSELSELLLVSKHIVSPQSNRPVIGIVQDTLLGVRKFTQRDTFLSKRDVMQIVYSTYSEENKPDPNKIDELLKNPAITRPIVLWTGKQVFSFILPKLNFKGESNGHIPVNEIRKNLKDKKRDIYNNLSKYFPTINISHPFDTQTFIQDGILHTGIIDTKSVGRSQGNLIHIIYNDLGHMECEKFINSLQKIINCWLSTIEGFSIGIGDTIADEDTMKVIVQTIDSAKAEVTKIIRDARGDRLERKPGLTLRETFEANINLALNKARDVSGTSAQKSLKENNNVKQMVLAGSKGSFINISQVTASVGQQNVENSRIPFGFRYRTLPHFCRDDYGPESRGFVENSFLSGLTPEEFFFHAMGGREGLIDTAIKTAETGYIQRRLIKSMENTAIKHDTSVRDFNGNVSQFIYGDDGYDATFLEDNKVECTLKSIDFEILDDPQSIHAIKNSLASERLTKTLANIRKMANIKLAPSDEELIKNEIADLIEGEINYFKNKIIYKKLGMMEPKRVFPFNMSRLFWNSKRQFPLHREESKKLNIIQGMQNKYNQNINADIRLDTDKKLNTDNINENFNDDNIIPTVKQIRSIKNEILGGITFTPLTRFFINSNLSTENIYKNKITTAGLKFILSKIKNNHCKAIASTNEMVGTLASQSIGEPATQMTLNTFHYAGVSATVTKGVPRLKELINVAKAIRTPSLSITLKKECCNDLAKVKFVQSNLEFLQIRDILRTAEIVFDPVFSATQVDEDRDLVAAFYEFPDESHNEILSRWVLRLILNRERMFNHNLQFAEVIARLENEFANDIQLIHSDENSEKLIIRLRARGSKNIEFYKKLMDTISKIHIKGYVGIKKAFICAENEAVQKKEEFHKNDVENLGAKVVNVEGVENKDNGDERVKRVKTASNEDQNNYSFEDNAKIINSIKKDEPEPSYYMKTEGINLLEILSDPYVDGRFVISNSIIETLEVLGVEACRQNLFNELRSVIESDGGYVNYRHLSLLSDTMTLKGILSGITRHGFNRSDASALMRASFEETVDVLMESAMTANHSSVLTVTESIMLGQVSPVGTGCVKAILDMEKIKETIPLSEYVFEFEKNEYDGTTLATPIIQSPSLNQDNSVWGTMTPDPYISPSMESSYINSPVLNIGSSQPNSNSETFIPINIHSPMSPSALISPSSNGNIHSSFSPDIQQQSPSSSLYSPLQSGTTVLPQIQRPIYSPTSSLGAFSPLSPGGLYSPTSPRGALSPLSPGGLFSPTSHRGAFSPLSPGGLYSPTSPRGAFSPTSPGGFYSPTSPRGLHATSPMSRTSNNNPNNIFYNPTSPGAFAYSPASPGKELSSLAQKRDVESAGLHKPKTPARPATTYNPNPQNYSPTSPKSGSSSEILYSPTTPSFRNVAQSPTSLNTNNSRSKGYTPLSPISKKLKIKKENEKKEEREERKYKN